jgi:hypothetical protein
MPRVQKANAYYSVAVYVSEENSCNYENGQKAEATKNRVKYI